MSAKELLNYGMKCVGAIKIAHGSFIVTLSDASAAGLERCIYAFLVGDEILRIGSSKRKLSTRLREWERDVSRAFAGDYARTPEGEAKIWRDTLAKRESGSVFARAGTMVSSPVGEFNLYQLEERALITRHTPRCNNDVTLGRVP